jgi:putative DNA primase/helicase
MQIPLGIRQVCNSGGAGNWRDDFARYLANRPVFILPDNDGVGQKHADVVARSLAGVATSIKVITLPGLRPKGDIVDWIADGGTREAFLALADAAPDWQPASSGSDEGNDDLPNEVTEDIVARRVVAAHLHLLRYDFSRGAYFEFDGTSWVQASPGTGLSLARQGLRAVNPQNKPELGRASTASGVERFIRSDQRIEIASSAWDSDPWLLGTPGGTLDLKTGLLRAASSCDRITRLAGAAPDFTATPSRWLQFLDEATNGDADLIRFLQQIAGYCLTGVTIEHALFFIYGPGGNGKSVFINILSALTGAYHCTAAMETFVASRNDRHPTELAELAGARLVTVTETEEGRSLAESRIKLLTGGDLIKARFMHQDFFEFQSQFKILIAGNNKPRLRNPDEAMRRRVNIIPFVHRPANPDPYLERALVAELPAIMAWAIVGCLDWRTHGLVRPPVVTDATAEYFEDQDTFGQWVAERCEAAPTAFTTSADLFRDWCSFARNAGLEPGTTVRFADRLSARGFRKERQRVNGVATRVWRGLTLLRPLDPMPDGVNA